jgi:hypothetical protein
LGQPVVVAVVNAVHGVGKALKVSGPEANPVGRKSMYSAPTAQACSMTVEKSK